MSLLEIMSWAWIALHTWHPWSFLSVHCDSSVARSLRARRVRSTWILRFCLLARFLLVNLLAQLRGALAVLEDRIVEVQVLPNLGRIVRRCLLSLVLLVDLVRVLSLLTIVRCRVLLLAVVGSLLELLLVKVRIAHGAAEVYKCH